MYKGKGLDLGTEPPCMKFRWVPLTRLSCVEVHSLYSLTSMCLLVLYACSASWLLSVLVTCRTISFSVCLPVYGVVPPILSFLSGWQRQGGRYLSRITPNFFKPSRVKPRKTRWILIAKPTEVNVVYTKTDCLLLTYMLHVTYDREIKSLSKTLQYGCIDIDVRNCVTFQHSRARRFALALGITSCTTHVRTWKKKCDR